MKKANKAKIAKQILAMAIAMSGEITISDFNFSDNKLINTLNFLNLFTMQNDLHVIVSEMAYVGFFNQSIN